VNNVVRARFPQKEYIVNTFKWRLLCLHIQFTWSKVLFAPALVVVFVIVVEIVIAGLPFRRAGVHPSSFRLSRG
jgi:hypothetical protein